MHNNFSRELQPHSHRIRPLDGEILSLVDLPNIAIPVCTTDFQGGRLPESESWGWEDDAGGVIWAAPPPLLPDTGVVA